MSSKMDDSKHDIGSVLKSPAKRMSTMLPSAIGMASCTQTWGASITISEQRGYQEDFYYYAQLLLSIVPALPIARYFQDSRVSVPVLLRRQASTYCSSSAHPVICSFPPMLTLYSLRLFREKAVHSGL